MRSSSLMDSPSSDDEQAVKYLLDWWELRPDEFRPADDPLGSTLVYRLGVHILINIATDGHLQRLVPDPHSDTWSTVIARAQALVS